MTRRPDPEPRGRPLPASVSMLTRMIRAEADLLADFRASAEMRDRAPEDVEATCAALNSDHVFHVARFFFLMEVLDCEREAALAAFIESHNERLAEFRLSAGARTRSPSELDKAEFGPDRVRVVLRTLREAGRLTLARPEIADFLFEHGGRRHIAKAVDTLIAAGLLFPVREEDELMLRVPRADRALVRTDGRLEAAYERYLAAVGGGGGM